METRGRFEIASTIKLLFPELYVSRANCYLMVSKTNFGIKLSFKALKTGIIENKAIDKACISDVQIT